MLLQPTISQSPLHHHHHHHHLSVSLPHRFLNSTLIKTKFSSKKKHPFIITCSSSSSHSYYIPTTQKPYGNRVVPRMQWNEIYKKISTVTLQDPEKSAASVLNQLESEGKKLKKYELYRVAMEFRKFGRHKSALEVYEWMNEREDKYTMLTGDNAIQLDLIAKMRGIPSAEDYFKNLPASSKDKRTYGSLLNVYTRALMKEKAESLFAEMKDRDYITHALPFNVMMTLYEKLNDHDKLESTVSEMIEKQIPLDLYTYNIWLTSRGSHRSTDEMEEVFEKMKLDRTVKLNWTTFSLLATKYIKLRQLEKAEDCLRRLEGMIKGRDRAPFHCLLSLYGVTGNKFEVLRVWNAYKSIFTYITNMGYHHVIASLVRLDDIEGAERIYEEWVSVKSTYDSRIANFLMDWYVRNGFFKKAEAFFEGIEKVGGKPNWNTWRILAGGFIGERRVTEALNCFDKALTASGSKFWKPEPEKVNSILKICEQENDSASKKVLLGILKRAGCLEDDNYMSSISMSNGNKLPMAKVRASDGDVDQMFLDQFQESV